MCKPPLSLAIALLLAGCGGGAASVDGALNDRGPNNGGPAVEVLTIAARPLPLDRRQPDRQVVGRLRYLGGLALKAGHPRFGGISGLLWAADCNRLLAASDEGQWIILEPQETGDQLVGIARGWTAPFGRPGGRPAARKSDVDAEALARDHRGRVWAFYEQIHRAERFPAVDACAPETLASRPDRTWMLPQTQGWAANGGAEAAAGIGRGFVYLSETATTVVGARDRRGVVASPGSTGRNARVFSYLVPPGFSPTDMAPLNGDGVDGRMLILHRRVAIPHGFSALLTEVGLSADDDRPVQPREIARLVRPLTVDDMEALAVRAEGARRFIYLMSDDNHSRFQRILLLKFELLEEAPDPVSSDSGFPDSAGGEPLRR